MPQDPHLYGQRPAKKQKKEMGLSSSLNFASQLSSLISAPSSDPAGGGASSSVAAGRARPSKHPKSDLFSVKSKKTGKKRRDGDHDDDGGGSDEAAGASTRRLRLKSPLGTEDDKRDLARARRKMEAKARLYNAMKRGDYIPQDNEAAPLVDFDRKWAERNPEGDGAAAAAPSSSGEDNDSSDDDDGDDTRAGGGGGGGGGSSNSNETVEYKDEFGRTRQTTRAQYLKEQRASARRALGASELEGMAARPLKRPENLIYGDAIQHAAFADPSVVSADTDRGRRMAELAAKRDRTPTPPPDSHFDGTAEIRTKGVGFYQFSGEKGQRREEMEGLAREREETERVRREREEARDQRRKVLEERRREIGRMRAEKMAESFLEGLAGEGGGGGGGGSLGGTVGGGGGGGGKTPDVLPVQEGESRKEEVPVEGGENEVVEKSMGEEASGQQ